jgi:hypothetical protein
MPGAAQSLATTDNVVVERDSGSAFRAQPKPCKVRGMALTTPNMKLGAKTLGEHSDAPSPPRPFLQGIPPNCSVLEKPGA